jgi:hypothetical protein
MIVDEQSWQEAEGHLPTVGALNARRIEPELECLLAVDHQGLRHLLLPVASESEWFVDRRSRGLILTGRSLEVEGQPERPFLDLCCTESSGRDAFNLVITAVVEQLEAKVPPPTAVRVVLDRWRRFWSQAPPEGLTAEQVRGLFGELWFLSEWLLSKDLQNLSRWVGSTGARHDFEWADYSVEAKTTTSVRGHIHQITALDQLDPPERGILLVYSLRVREEASASHSLTTAVTSVLAQLQGVADLLAVFEDRLAQSGYSSLHDYRYREMRFRIVDERLYRVAEGFPRLSVDMLVGGIPIGIEGIKYETNLEVCRQLVMAEKPSGWTP